MLLPSVLDSTLSPRRRRLVDAVGEEDEAVRSAGAVAAALHHR